MSESRTLTNKCLTGIQISLAELQSLLSELEGRNEGQAANIESLTATLKTKDEIIDVRIHPIQKILLLSGNNQQLGIGSFPSRCI